MVRLFYNKQVLHKASVGIFIFLILSVLYCFSGSRTEEANKKLNVPEDGMINKMNAPSRKETIVPGEYIITLAAENPDGSEYLLILFKHLEPVRISPVKKGEVYLIRFKKNINLDDLRKETDSEPRIKDIQPNFIYRINPPSGKGSRLPGKERAVPQ